MKLAICLGLTRVDPAAYGGWDGVCPGCDRDAARFATLCHDAGFDGVQVLVNAMADSRHVKQAFIETAKLLQADDLLLLYNSGHGGQQPDEDGDELDGRDETLCWWDGEVVDDMIGAYLRRLRKGVRVVFITDTCNAGTNYRGMRRAKSSPVRLSEGVAPKLRASLLHFGGCSDGRSSYGDETGGVFTNAMIDAHKRARRPISWWEWHLRTQPRMPDWQTPVYGEWGTPSFVDRNALT